MTRDCVTFKIKTNYHTEDGPEFLNFSLARKCWDYRRAQPCAEDGTQGFLSIVGKHYRLGSIPVHTRENSIVLTVSGTARLGESDFLGGTHLTYSLWTSPHTGPRLPWIWSPIKVESYV